jgi:hypothetical protein
MYAPAEAASGIVDFSDGAAILGSSFLDAKGATSLSVTTLAIGTHIITARFIGNSTTAASTSTPLVVTVTAPVMARILRADQK